MKKIISSLLLVTLVFASVLAMIPASAATPTEYNVMGDSDATKQFNGEGNVFYYDYWKYVNEYTETDFPMPDEYKGTNDTFMLRLGKNAGGGTASVCDGDISTNKFDHSMNANKVPTINGVTYDHGFGYSFKNSVMVDGVELYIPANNINDKANTINYIAVYGAVRANTYGKAAEKVLLATFDSAAIANAPAAQGDSTVKVVSGDFNMAMKVDYIFFCVNISSEDGYYSFTEIKVNGFEINGNEPDFSALRTAYEECKALDISKYTTASWNALQTAINNSYAVNKNASSTQTEIDAAFNAIKDARNELALMPASTEAKNALTYQIDRYNALKAIQDAKTTYTSTSWNAVVTAYTTKVVLLENSELAPQKDIEDATAALKTAIDALIPLGDNKALTAAITEAEKLKAEDYTSNALAWATFVAELNSAKSVAASEATQTEIDDALASLKQVIAALEAPNTTPDSGATTTPPADTNTSTNTNTNTNTNTDTSTNNNATNTPSTDTPKPEDTTNKFEDTTDKTEDETDKVEEDTEEVTDDATIVPDAEDVTDQIVPTPAKKKCGSAVGTTAVVVGIVATLGTALVVKKKD